jgi:murein DD-endopeptidase MepM/ murein hydrolase activator NlpD
LNLNALLAVVVVVGIIALGVFAWARLESSPPVLTGPETILLGAEPQNVTISVQEEGMGLRAITARLIDAKGEKPLVTEKIRGSWQEGSLEHEREIDLVLDAESLDLEDGSARLLIEAEDWSWRNNRGTLEVGVEIDRVAPGVAVRSGLTYVDRGGAATVVYEISEPAERDGVEVTGANGTLFYPGHPFPGASGGEDFDANGEGSRAGRRVAIFAIDRDAGPNPQVSVVAADRAGNRSSARWNLMVKPRVFPQGKVNLPSSFLHDVVPALASKAGIDVSDPVAAFEQVNTELRSRNEAEIAERLAETEPEPLWTGGFEQLANSKVTSRFAEERVYVVEGRPVSEAIHFGYDLASLAGAPITAANAGRVRFAGDLGIYGNCVLVDHGLGVGSLYGHLSRIDVSEGEAVDKGQRLGLSGATGLAGGDHLHFAMRVGPTYVDPVEWWDPKWVREHVDVRLDR